MQLNNIVSEGKKQELAVTRGDTIKCTIIMEDFPLSLLINDRSSRQKKDGRRREGKKEGRKED